MKTISSFVALIACTAACARAKVNNDAGGLPATDASSPITGDAASTTGGHAGTDTAAAAGGSAATGDAAIDAYPDAASVDDPACKAALICDDFEANVAAASPPLTWTNLVSGGGVVRVDTTHAFSGSKSVLVTTTANSASNKAFITKMLPVLADNSFFGRMMVWVTAVPNNVHWDNIRALGKLPGTNAEANYNYGGGGGKYMANYYTPGQDCWKNSKSLMPTGRWACIEWQYNGTGNEMHYWLDGAAIADLTVIMKGDGCSGNNLWTAPTFDHVLLGWYNAQASAIPIEMWLDDVAIDSKRISCPPPH